MASRLVLSLSLALGLLLAALPCARAIVQSSGELQSCVRNGATAELDVKCEKKVVVSVAVGNDQSIATEQLDFSLACVGSPDGSCPCPCNYQADADCKCRDLTAPLKLTVTKSTVWASYPMQYLTSFNYKPFEAIVRPHGKICLDNDYETSPTCGWYYVGSYRVPDSQGFACECSSSQIWDNTVGSGNQERTRANINCDFFSDPLNILVGKPPCSAHCLSFDPLWYSGYQLGPPSLQFEITITVDVPVAMESTPSPASGGSGSTESGNVSVAAGSDGAANGTNSTANTTNPGGAGSSPTPPSNGAPAPPSNGVPAITYRREVLTLNPSVTLAATSSRLVSSHLLGDLVTYTSLPVFNSHVLMVPQPDGWTVDDILTKTNRSSWMLLHNNYVDMSDTACNKVGTVFSAFRNQPNGCSRAPQTCLGSQLKDLEAADEQRVATGKVPLHMVTRHTYGWDSKMATFNGGPLSFALPVASQSNSLVVINVAADFVQLTTNSSPGNITGARLCKFAETGCGGFEAGASRGYLHVNVSNTGFANASFTLTVTNCTANVRPVEARSLVLPAGGRMTLEPPFQIYVEDPFAEENRSCWLTMYNSQARTVDSLQVRFYTNATVYDEKPEGGLNRTGDGAGELPGNSTACGVRCGAFWDMICYVQNSCWGKFGALLGTTVAIASAIAGLVVLAKMGLLMACLGSVTSCFARCCCCGSRQQDQEDKLSAKKQAQSTHKLQAAEAAKPPVWQGKPWSPAAKKLPDIQTVTGALTWPRAHLPASSQPEVASPAYLVNNATQAGVPRLLAQRGRESFNRQWERLSAAVSGTAYTRDAEDDGALLMQSPAQRPDMVNPLYRQQ